MNLGSPPRIGGNVYTSASPGPGSPKRHPVYTSRAALALSLSLSLAAAACGSGAVSSTSGGSSPTGATGTAGSGATSSAGTGGATASSSGTGGTSSGPIDFCTGCTLKPGCITFADGSINEASGVAASALHDGVYYLHNDSGDDPRFFATNCAGDDLGEFDVPMATAVDWEDIARGPCDAGHCLFFADIGDNTETRTDYAVYRVTEPSAVGAGEHQLSSTKFPFLYPDGSHDAETILVHPLTGEISIVTKLKEAGFSGVYTFPTPLKPGEVVTLTKTGEVAAPSGSVRITSGAVHPEALGVLLRTYTSLFFYPMTPSQTLAEALSATPCEVPVMLELQGESVTFTDDGRGYLTVSEQTGQSLHFAACK